MNTKEFLELLKSNLDKELVFEYQAGHTVDANYHLTEIKNVSFETVDCGGNPRNWKETQIQLWESPSEIGKTEYLTTQKAESIFGVVNAINPLWLDTEIKVEFGNDHFHTSVMKVSGFEVTDSRLLIKLYEEKTLCKDPSVCVDDEGEASCCSTDESGCC